MSLQNHQYIDCFLGPHKGEFVPIRIQSIHRQRCPLRHIQAGQAATCAISFTNSNASRNPPSGFRLRKGQVILLTHPSQAFWEFEADLHVLYHPSLFSTGIQGVIYCGSVRQGVRVIHIEPASPLISDTTSSGTSSPTSDLFSQTSPSSNRISPTPLHRKNSVHPPSTCGLATGQRGRVRFRFVYEPEWLALGRTVLFRGEGRMKCVGKVSLLSGSPTHAHTR